MAGAERLILYRRDVRTAARVIVIGQTIADNLFPGTDPIGQDIRVMNLPFRVVGVMVRKGQDPAGPRSGRRRVCAVHDRAEENARQRDRIQIAYVSAISQDATYTAQSQITDLLRQRHKLTASEPNDFTVRNMTDVAEAANETSKTMTILLACIAGVSLLVGGIGIMNIMLVSVTERTREIGIRMAIGARSSAVRSQFLIESIVLSLTGGTVGIILGVALSLAIPAFLGWPTLVSMMAIIGSVLFSVAVGIFFGYYPARKAASLDPIEALKIRVIEPRIYTDEDGCGIRYASHEPTHPLARCLLFCFLVFISVAQQRRTQTISIETPTTRAADRGGPVSLRLSRAFRRSVCRQTDSGG